MVTRLLVMVTRLLVMVTRPARHGDEHGGSMGWKRWLKCRTSA
jgi:hypothetical protein